MICPRCGNEWDASKSPCTRCGLVIRFPNQVSAGGRPAGPAFPPRGMSPQSGDLPPYTPSAPLRGQSGLPNTPPTSLSGPRSLTSTRSQKSGPMPPVSRSLEGLRRQGSGGSNPFSQPLPSQALGTDPLAGGRPNLAAQRPPLTYPPTGRLGDLSAPSRPQVPTRPNRNSGVLPSEAFRIGSGGSPLRSSRLQSDPLVREAAQYGQVQQVTPPYPQSMNGSNGATSAAPSSSRPLMPGALLRGGRYRLQELLERQEWLNGVFEATWTAQDAQRAGAQVMVCELVIPDNASVVMQSMLRMSTVSLTAIGRHPHVPTLWDAFSDQGRNFFVFEYVDGESLLARMRRTGRALDEQEVVEFCLQMTEVLDSLAQQSPPLVHGLIRPEHIVVSRASSQYMLTNFSIVLAGGATQFVAGQDRVRLSPYAAPEMSRGVIDGRLDLYSLLATAYHLVTGSMPTGVSGSIPPAHRLNPNISAEFDAILSKGLRPISSQRYQRPAELRQDLLAMRSVSGSLATGSGQWYERSLQSAPLTPKPTLSPPTPNTPDSVAQALPRMLSSTMQEEDQRSLLPRPEELPPMREANDTVNSLLWTVGLVIAIVGSVIIARGAF